MAQPAQVFNVNNSSEYCLKCLLEPLDGGCKEEFMMLPGGGTVVNKRSQHALLSVAFCEKDGNRFTLAICHERVPVQAGIPFHVNSQDKHSGNRRYERTLCNTIDFVRAFVNMSLAHVLAETCRDRSPLLAPPCPAVTPGWIQSIANNIQFHNQETRLPHLAEHLGPPEAGQMAQAFTVDNRTGHRVKCLLESPDDWRGEEFMLLPGEKKVINKRSQRGLLSVAFCEKDGNRFALAICHERVPVQAGIPFYVNPQDKHPGNRRCERTLCNTIDFVRTFVNMSLSRVLAEINR